MFKFERGGKFEYSYKAVAVAMQLQMAVFAMPQSVLDEARNISVFCEDGRKTGHVLASACRDAVDRLLKQGVG